MIINNTPIEVYDGILVKREDLSCLPPGPPFAKVRGLQKRLEYLKRKGVSIVGYTETNISQAGIGVSWLCQELNMTAVIYCPMYKKPQAILNGYRKQWENFGAVIMEIPAGMAKVNYYICKKKLLEEFGASAIMLPLGLPFKESITAVSEEFKLTLPKIKNIKSVVMCIGSGTMAAGVLKGIYESPLQKIKLYGILCRKSKNIVEKKKKILMGSETISFISKTDFSVIDMGWEYTQESKSECPFPTNKYYDLKAWQWLMENKNKIPQPILFWNIGA